MKECTESGSIPMHDKRTRKNRQSQELASDFKKLLVLDEVPGFLF